MQGASEIVARLRICYAREIETVEYYLVNAIDLEGDRAEPVKNLLDEEVQTALSHARRLAKRIKAIAQGSLALPSLQNGKQTLADQADIDSFLRDAIKSLETAMEQYEGIIKLCDGHDVLTQDLVIELLVDERERRRRFMAFLPEE
jgi:ferritin-like protein